MLACIYMGSERLGPLQAHISMKTEFESQVRLLLKCWQNGFHSGKRAWTKHKERKSGQTIAFIVGSSKGMVSFGSYSKMLLMMQTTTWWLHKTEEPWWFAIQLKSSMWGNTQRRIIVNCVPRSYNRSKTTEWTVEWGVTGKAEDSTSNVGRHWTILNTEDASISSFEFSFPKKSIPYLQERDRSLFVSLVGNWSIHSRHPRSHLVLQ